jgi:integrase
VGDIIERTLKSGRIAYYARYVEIDGMRTSRKIGSKTPEEASTRLAVIEERVASGQPGIVRPRRKAPAAPKLTVRDLAERYCGTGKAIEGVEVDGRPVKKFETGAAEDARDPRKYRRQFWSVLKCHVLDVIGDMAPEDVKRSDVVRVVDAMHGQKRRTTQKAVRHISKLYNWALDRALVSCSNPAQRQKTPKYKENNDYYRVDEVARLTAKAAEKMPDLYPIVSLAFYGGLRKGELAALQWRDVDLEAGRADVSRSWKHDERKSGDTVVVHFHPRLLAILKAHHDEQTPESPEALVFPDPRTGKMRDEFDLWGLDKLIELAEVRRFERPWHSFRHACGTSLAATGASLAEIQAALGQTTLEMARRYVKVANEQVRRRVRALPDVVDLNSKRKQRKAGGA